MKEYIESTYGVSAEFPWIKYPEYMVFRHIGNRKWFALVMEVLKEKLGLKNSGMLDIVNVKCDSVLIGSLRSENGFFPAYHMNKENWITIALDNSVSDEKIMLLLDMSYELTDSKSKSRKAKE